MAGQRFTGLIDIIKRLFKKYQRDNANIIVSSISFYILLTFIPFTLLSIYILGFVIDISQPSIQIERFIKNIVPDPYNTIIVKRVIRELNIISISKRLSGPLGMIFLFLFTMKLFSVMRPAFLIIFGRGPEGFLKGKGKELLLTIVFSIGQTIMFFSFIFSLIIQSKVTKIIPHALAKTYFIYLFSLIDMSVTFFILSLLYFFLTPKKKKSILILSTLIGTILWHLGKFLFKYYILHVMRFTALLGTYGIFVAFLFWIYFSVFVFIVCAELQAVLMNIPIREPRPNSCPSPARP
ncbi:MAG TPA: YihY/virulence factor BrkB family protein [Syntrophorhabdaceae bacterium]|nr:YihY/virulence factor BrkB family protein [Syntrophorhabdaceae bacterium]